MNLKEAQKRIWNKSTFKEKLLLVFWDIVFRIQHHFRRITKLCPHDSTFGGLGADKAICIDCGELITQEKG